AVRPPAPAGGFSAAGLVVEPEHDLVPGRRGLLIGRAAGRPARGADPDLDVWAGRHADVATADLGYRLASAHVGAHPHQRRCGVSVVDVAAGIWAARDLEHRGVGA